MKEENEDPDLIELPNYVAHPSPEWKEMRKFQIMQVLLWSLVLLSVILVAIVGLLFLREMVKLVNK